MRVDDKIRDTIVAIGGVDSRGRFVPFGTGFVVVNQIEEDFYQNIVTARHVVDGVEAAFGDGEVRVRANTRDGGALVLPAPIWHRHQDENVDITIGPGGMDREVFSIRMFECGSELILTPDHIEKNDIGVGDDIFAVGMFVQRMGETKNLPIVRAGIISAMPEEEIRTQYGRHEAYLVETRSFDGLSGSPVFVQLPPLRYSVSGDGHKVVPSEYSHHLMGVLLGHNEVRNEQDIILLEE